MSAPTLPDDSRRPAGAAPPAFPGEGARRLDPRVGGPLRGIGYLVVSGQWRFAIIGAVAFLCSARRRDPLLAALRISGRRRARSGSTAGSSAAATGRSRSSASRTRTSPRGRLTGCSASPGEVRNRRARARSGRRRAPGDHAQGRRAPRAGPGATGRDAAAVEQTSRRTGRRSMRWISGACSSPARSTSRLPYSRA